MLIFKSQFETIGIQSFYPAFQCCCYHAYRMCTASCGGAAVTWPPEEVKDSAALLLGNWDWIVPKDKIQEWD